MASPHKIDIQIENGNNVYERDVMNNNYEYVVETANDSIISKICHFD